MQRHYEMTFLCQRMAAEYVVNSSSYLLKLVHGEGRQWAQEAGDNKVIQAALQGFIKFGISLLGSQFPFRLNKINFTFAKLQLLGVYYFRHLQSTYIQREEDNMIRVWTCLRKIKQTAKKKLFGIKWWFSTRGGNPSLGPPTSVRFQVFAELWCKIISMWETRPCPLNLKAQLVCTEKFQDADFSFLSCCHGSYFTVRLSLLFYFPPQLASHSTNLCMFLFISEFFAILGKNPPGTLQMCDQVVILSSGFVVKTKHHQVSLPSMQSVDNSDAMTHLFHLLRDLICQICKTQESTYCFPSPPSPWGFFPLLTPFHCTPCFTKKVSKLPRHCC